MHERRQTITRRAAGVRVAPPVAALVGLGVLVGGASAAFAQSNQPAADHDDDLPTTTSTQPGATTTRARPRRRRRQRRRPPRPPPPSQPPPPDNDSDVELSSTRTAVEEAAAACRRRPGHHVHHGRQPAGAGQRHRGRPGHHDDHRALRPDEGSSADDENRLIWMIIAGLAGVAVLVAVLTWRYWLLTRPGLVLEGDQADDVRGGAGGPRYGGTAPPGRAVRPVVGAKPTRSGTSPGILAERSWDRPTPETPRADRPRPAHRSPVARVRAPAPEGARRRRGGPGAPGGQGGPGGRWPPRHHAAGRSWWPAGDLPGEGEPEPQAAGPGHRAATGPGRAAGVGRSPPEPAWRA